MKHLVLVLVMFVTISIAYGQNKWQQKKINYFVEEATKEFSLDKKQQKQLLNARNAYMVDFAAVGKKAKSNEITEEQKKEELKVVNKKFNVFMVELTGMTNKQLQPFYKRIREGMKTVK